MYWCVSVLHPHPCACRKHVQTRAIAFYQGITVCILPWISDSLSRFEICHILIYKIKVAISQYTGMDWDDFTDCLIAESVGVDCVLLGGSPLYLTSWGSHSQQWLFAPQHSGKQIWSRNEWRSRSTIRLSCMTGQDVIYDAKFYLSTPMATDTVVRLSPARARHVGSCAR